MDELSSLYVRMASGVHSQLHHPASVIGFVDQMQSRVEKSSAPRKSFLIDPTTPHSDVVIAESSALKPSVGWVTLQVTEGIRRGTHEWGVRIEHQGESNDESGLMLGIVPKSFSKYDTFISQGGGWCLSRAGKFYGHWRRTDAGGGALTFGTGDRVVLTLDYEAAVMTVRVGEKVVVGELSGLNMEVFPAVSLHYRHQHVRFDHHAVKETSSQQLPWLQRQAFPLAPAYIPLRFREVQSLPLNSYLFSHLFCGGGGDSLEGSSAAAMEGYSPSLPTQPAAKEQRAMRLYMSAEASAARLTVLSCAFAAVRRYVAVLPGKTSFLAPHVTAEYLRQRLYEAARENILRYGSSSGSGALAATSSSSPSSSVSLFGGGGFLRGGGGGGATNRDSAVAGGGAGYDAALNCGAVIVVHLFIRAVTGGQEGVAAPLVVSFRDFLLTLPVFSLAECGGGDGGGEGAGSVLTPDTVQLAVDHIVRLLDASADLSATAAARGRQGATKDGAGDTTVSAVTAALLEVAVLLALQRGLVSEVLRVCRYLLRVPDGVLSPALLEWLRRHSGRLAPLPSLPDLGCALKHACEDPASFTPTQVDPATVVLSVGYGAGAVLYLHTADGLSKYGPSAAAPYAVLAVTRQPAAYCVGASRSSMAVTHTHVLLITDRMAVEEVALVIYSLQLEHPQVLRWADMHSSWPRSPNANPQLATMMEDCVLLLYERSTSTSPTTSRTPNGHLGSRNSASPLAAAPPPPLSEETDIMASCFSVAAPALTSTASAPLGAPLWTRTLQLPPPTPTTCLRFDRCLLLRKPSLVDLGSPEASLTVPGGHVTVELWMQFLDKQDAATLYQHGDRSTNGEIFLELSKWEGAYCVRGGYRHDVRGSCLVSAPLPPTAESRPLHIGLVFNGRWRLFFEGEEIAGNRQGPHVSLDAPKQRWTAGAGCTCLLTGLRVWRVGRTAREVHRDYRRPLDGDEPGLVAQFFFNERSGNVALNYVQQTKASHAVCSGGATSVPCNAHPLSSCVSASPSLPAEGRTVVCARLHEWRDLTCTTCCVTGRTLLLSTPVSGDESPYPAKDGGRALLFFDLSSGVAHRSLFFLTSRSPVQHCMRADPAGRLWEMFDVDANLVKGEQEVSSLLSLLGTTGAAPQRTRERVLAVVPLSLAEEKDKEERLCGLLDDGDALPLGGHGGSRSSRKTHVGASDLPAQQTKFCPSRTVGGSDNGGMQALSNVLNTHTESGQTASLMSPSFATPLGHPQSQQFSASAKYSDAALWLLQLLAAHAEADSGADAALFSPLADDVSSRCVAEVRVILGEHLRVVKAANARRAVALKSSLSWVVVAAALRVLLRLIRRVRAFGLHPAPLGLTVVKETATADAQMGGGVKDCHSSDNNSSNSGGGGAPASEVTMALLLRELHTSSVRRRAGSSLLHVRPTGTTAGAVPSLTASSPAADGADIADSSTLLGLLADVLNEDGLTLSPAVVALARTVTMEGVGLLLPDVRQRARLLRDLLHASAASPSKLAASLQPFRGVGAGADDAKSGKAVTEAAVEDRVPAMNVLLDAVAQSFTTVLAAAPLLDVNNGVASLSDVCDTLRTLLEESAQQWRRGWAAPSPSPSRLCSAAGPPTAAHPLSHSFHSFAFSLSEAIASLQLLLLSACQGSRWEVALSQMHSSGDTAGTSANGGGRGMGVAGISRAAGGGSGEGSGGAGSNLNAINSGSGVGNNNNTALAGMRGGVSAAALDLQHLCFSQAVSYHPCIRIYYAALFACAESCLSLCGEQQDALEKLTSTSAASAAEVAESRAALASMVASLGPTFLTAPLHTALSAIPLVLTMEDGRWFLGQLDQLLRRSEKLLEAVGESTGADANESAIDTDGAAAPTATTEGSSANHERSSASSASTFVTAARCLLTSLRESLSYASVWVAAFLFNCTTVSSASVKEAEVRQRLGLASVTATPTAQRTVTNLTATLNGRLEQEAAGLLSPRLRGSPVEEEAAACVWEHPLLEGGVWPSVQPADAVSAASTRATPPRRDVYVKGLIQNTAYWSAKQAAFDHLSSRASTTIAPLITSMAAAALHLSPLPLQSLSALQVEQLMSDVMRRLSRPVRTELMSRREEKEEGDDSGGGSPAILPNVPSPASRQQTLAATVAELLQRCELLLRVRTCSELWAAEDALFAIPTCDLEAVPPLPAARSKARRVWHVYKQRHMRYRAHVTSQPCYTLHEATQLVKHVILSRRTTAASLLAALRQRETLATLRETGIGHLLELVKRAPCRAESVARLLSAYGCGAQTHFEGGLRGCGYDCVMRIRHVFYELLRCAVAASLPPAAEQRGRFSLTSLSTSSAASVLCGLLDRAWQPREFALFVQLRVMPTLMERYVTLFTPLFDTNASVGDNSQGTGEHDSGRQPSQANVLKTSDRLSTTETSSKAISVARDGASSLCSVELRPVALAERRHRDHVITAQQARRSSKSALVSAAVLQRHSAIGEAGQRGSVLNDGRGSCGGGGGAASDGPLQYTAGEATQAKVWLTIKNLVLQTTAMLSPKQLPLLSRVEQSAVMSFLADALRAMGTELQRCRDVLARAVKDTPVLLAQAGDAAVLEPLVTVQDQVELLCSLLSAVAGTLCTTSAAMDADATGRPRAAVFAAEPAEGGSGEGEDVAHLLSASLSTVCAGVADTLLELALLDVYHAHVVRREAGVGGVVRDAAACARIAGLLLCRCQPTAVRCSTATDPSTAASSCSSPSPLHGLPSAAASAWRDMYSSPVFSAVPLEASSSVDGGHPCLQRWMDLGTYAMATTGLSRTAQHILLALRRLLCQPAWAGELRCFAAAYKRLLLAYAKCIQGGIFTGEGRENGSGGASAAAASCRRVRELSATQLYVWAVVLGGQLLTPPVDLGMQVSYLDEKDGFRPTLAYVVDLESVAVSSTAAQPSSTSPSKAPSPQTSPFGGSSIHRHLRGSSHSPSKTAAAVVADGERVRSVVAVPTDESGCCSREEEVSLSPHQLFLADWELPIVVPPYADLAEDFLMPALQHCVPLLATKLDAAVAFTAVELTVFVSLLHLTAGVTRSRPDLGRRLIESGAMQSIRQHALQGVVRLPFPSRVLTEWAALVAVRAAEEAAEHLYKVGEGCTGEEATEEGEEGREGLRQGLDGSSPGSSPASTSRSVSPAAVASVRTPFPVSAVPNSRPTYTSLSPPLVASEALLDTFRSGGLATSTPTFLVGSGGASALAVTSVSSPVSAPTGLTPGIAGDYGLLRLVRSFGVFANTYGSVRGSLTGSTNAAASANSSSSYAGGTPAPARIPPRTEAASASGRAPMFLSFPMWDAHPLQRSSGNGDGNESPVLPHSAVHQGCCPPTPAAVTITPSNPEGCFPVWEDGFAVEAAVILNDGDVYPAIGDALSIPCSWARVSDSDYEEDGLPPASPSPFEFPLITLYAAAEPAETATTAAAAAAKESLFPFIQIKVHRSCLSATINVPLGTTPDGSQPGGDVEMIFLTKHMRREDWHHCMHVSLMCNAACVTLCRSGDAANVELRGDVGRRLETLLRREGFIRSVVLGRAAKEESVVSPSSTLHSGSSNNRATAVPAREVDGPMALLGGLRIWGTSVLRTSVRVIAELVARDHALQPFGLPEHLCFFEMKEGSGGVVHSADAAQQYRGVCSGSVRWSIEPLPLGFYPAIELNAGRARTGVATNPASSTRLPRSTMSALVQSLSPFYFARFGGDVMWSLLSLVARHATITALEVGMSPAYALLMTLPEKTAGCAGSGNLPTRTACFDPRHVLDPSQKLSYQLMRLFQLQDTGCLPNRHERLIHGVVQRLVTVLAADDEGRHTSEVPAVPETSLLATFVSDTALLLRQLRRDDGEMFVIELPPASSPPSTAPTASLQGTAVLPLALTNGGTGVLIFDAKYRNMEQVMLYKDKELKNILAKYPDGQGGWPAYTLTAAEAPWAFLRSVPSSVGHRQTTDAKANDVALSSSILTVTVKSLRPVIMHAVVRALCEALRTLAARVRRPSPHSRRTRRGRAELKEEECSAAQLAAARLLDARVITSLVQQSSARSSEDDCVHFALLLTEVLQLWRCMPAVSPHDQVPLAMVMSHLNLPLCSIVHHVSSDADLGSLVSATTGTYSPYVQALVGLWTAAIQLDSAWAGRTYLQQLQARWQRLLRTWQSAAVLRPSAMTTPATSSRVPPASNEERRSTADAVPKPLQPYTPPSSPSTRPSALASDVAYARAQLHSAANANETALPLPPSQEGSRKAKVPEKWRLHRASPCVVGLVTVEAASSSSPPSGGAEEAVEGGTQHTIAPQRAPWPRGVTRKGNGLWVVKGGHGSRSGSSHADDGPEAGQGDPARTKAGSSSSPSSAAVATTVRSSVGFTTGALYWEVYVTNISRADHSASLRNGATLASNVLVGVATEHWAPTFTAVGADGAGVFVGSDAESWAFDGGRALRYYKGYNLESSPRTRWKADDVVGFVLDIPRNRLCCLHNGRLVSEFNDHFLSPQQRAGQAALFPVVICTGEGSCEVNFGATSFASTPPPGCLPVDPSLYVSEETSRVWRLVLAGELVTSTTAKRLLGAGDSSSSGNNSSGEQEDEEKELRESLAASSDGRKGGSAEKQPRPRRPPLLTHPALPFLCRHVARHTRGRFGPLDVVLLCADGNAKTAAARECKTDKEASLLLGSVAVTSGRWYFEVVVPGEPAFHVGWYAWKALEEQGGSTGVAGNTAGNVAANSPMSSLLPLSNGRPQLGHDAASWGFDAARMTARHNKHQITFARRGWRCGDVVGCMLDCDAGTMAFAVNGETLGVVHSSSNGGVGGRSLTPSPPPPQQQQQPTSPHPSLASTAETTSTGASQRHPVTGPSASGTSNRSSSDLAAAVQSSGAGDDGGSGGSAALFAGVSLKEVRGLVPAILLEPKSSLVCLWNEDELLYPPAEGGYRALGGAQVVHDALVEVVTQPPPTTHGSHRAPHMSAETTAVVSHTHHSEKPTATRSNVLSTAAAPPTDSVNAAALQKLLYYASKVQELHPTSLRSFTMPSLFGIPPLPASLTAIANRPVEHNAEGKEVEEQGWRSPTQALPPPSQQHQQQQRDLCYASGLEAAQLHTHLAALLFFAHLSSFLHPFAYAASLPNTVEDTPLSNTWAMTKLCHTLQRCRTLAPPWTALRLLQWSLSASNGPGDAVRLNVNRRKALTVVRDPSASATRRLRDSLFGQVYQLLTTKPPALFTTNKKMWAVTFYGEGADDVGGPYRECLTQMCEELMSASLTLFVPSANMTSELGEVRDGFVVNPVCAPPVELLMYRFLGRLMGGCLRGGEPLSLYLPSTLWKHLVGEPADDTDLARIDVATLNAMEYVERIAAVTDDCGGASTSLTDADVAERNTELAELCPGGFSLLNDAGVVETLVPGGDQIPVTVHNARLYVHLVREYKLYGSGAAQQRALQQGFHEVVPLSSVAGLKWYELEELVCGRCDYDPDALIDAARLDGVDAADTRLRFLREVLRGFTRHQRALFIRFVSGRERLPPGIRLKIMPDDTSNGGTVPSFTPRRTAAAPATGASAGAVMTPQPPPPQQASRDGSSDGEGSSGGWGGTARSGSFVRHNTLQLGRRSSAHVTNTSTNINATTNDSSAPQLPSPPQLGFTPPPSQSMTLSLRLARTMPPPVLQPRQLLTGQRGSPTTNTNYTTSSAVTTLSAHAAHSTATSQRHPAPDQNVDLVTCDDTRLPHASTCFYWLRLPRYSSAAVMAERLLFAIEQCVDIDADFRVHDTDVAEQEAGPTLARVSSDDDDLFEDFSHLQ